MQWKDKRVFVTGAAGFIGSALTSRLAIEGANVTALVHRQAYANWAPRPQLHATVVSGDVRDADLMREIVAKGEIEYVFHLAASAIVRIAARDPRTTWDDNVMGTVSVLEAVRACGSQVRQTVCTSSDKAYGDSDRLPYREDFPLRPRNTYDASKAAADLLAQSYASQYDLPVIVTRKCNVYGPGDPNESRIVPNTIRRIRRKEAPMVYSDIAPMQREFIHIDDVCDALLLAGGAHESNVYNIGGSEPVSILNLVSMIQAKMGSSLAPIVVPRAPLFREIQKQCVDGTKFRNRFDWTPRIGLVEGLDDTISRT